MIEVVNSGVPYDPTQSDLIHDVMGLQTRLTERDLKNDQVTSTDKAVMLDSEVRPKRGWTLVDRGLDLIIQHVDEVYPGTNDILYKVFARG